MTWKRFKELVEAAGVTDEQEIWYIDVSSPTEKSLSVCPEDKNNPDDIGFTAST